MGGRGGRDGGRRAEIQEIEDHQGGWRESIYMGTDGKRGPDGSQEEVERRTGTAGEQRGRKGDGEKSRETDKPDEMETTIVQVWQGTRSRQSAESIA